MNRLTFSTAAIVMTLVTLSRADITGTVTLDGQAPEMKIIAMPPQCAKFHVDPPEEETVVVDEKNHLANVVISLKGIEGKFNPPAEPAVIEQRGCIYEPHVLAMMVGQKLKAMNHDPFAHNIHVLPKANAEQNLQMPIVGHGDPDGQELKTPQAAEIMRVKCDIHGWMTMYVAVFEHPFFAVSDWAGKFTIPTQGLKDGQYEVEAWQEKYGRQMFKVNVVKGKAILDIKFRSGKPGEFIPIASRAQRLQAWYANAPSSPLTVSLLASVLRNPYSGPRLQAAEYLRKLGPRASIAAPDCAAVLITSEDRILNSAVADALCAMGSAAAGVSAPLNNARAEGHLHFGTDNFIRRVLISIAPELRVQDEPYIDQLSDHDPQKRLNAALLLTNAAPPEVIDALVHAITTKDFLAREGFTIAIAQAHPHSENVLPILKQLSHDENTTLRAEALAALKSLQPTSGPAKP